MPPKKPVDQKSGTALGGFLTVLGFSGVYLAVELMFLPAGVST